MSWEFLRFQDTLDLAKWIDPATVRIRIRRDAVVDGQVVATVSHCNTCPAEDIAEALKHADEVMHHHFNSWTIRVTEAEARAALGAPPEPPKKRPRSKK